MTKRPIIDLSAFNGDGEKKVKLSEKVNLVPEKSSETRFGVKSFLSTASTCAFNGIIKHRFSDFHVHEIDQFGKVVELSSISAAQTQEDHHIIPITIPIIDQAKEEEVVPAEAELDHHQTESITKTCREIAEITESIEFASSLEDLINSVIATPSASVSSPVVPTKEKRTVIHNLTRSLNVLLHDRFIDSKTVNSNCIVFTISKKTKSSKKQSSQKSNGGESKMNWTERGEYCHFTLYKENKDTSEAISLLAKLLRVESKLFTMCGTKDKRGITVQRVSVYRVTKERLSGLNKTLRGIKLGNFSYEKTRLQLGDSVGNVFSVVVRKVESPMDKTLLLQECTKTLSERGFINYFGMQRFGSRHVSTHTIGALLLSEKWEEACFQILGRDEPPPIKASPPGTPDFYTAKEYLFQTGDYESALPMFPRFCVGERSIIASVLNQKKKGGKVDWLQAVQSITRNLRLMYIHAYQSYVWNEMVSARHEKHGFQLTIGDLVEVNTPAEVPGPTPIEEEESDNQESIRGLSKVLQITSKSDAQRFSIYDLVVPLPGHAVTYPPNLTREFGECMAKDGFKPDQMHRKVRDMNLPGFYRHVYARPTDFKARLVRYCESATPVDFLQSDWDRMQGGGGGGGVVGGEDGDSTAFVFEFGLASSQYATMLLREIMKTETSSAHQSQLSKDVMNSSTNHSSTTNHLSTN